MNDLNRIERIYGSVAEYRRVLDEEPCDEPSEAELAESERLWQDYRMKVKSANGTPSDAIIKLRSDYIASSRDNYYAFVNKALALINDIYGVEFSADGTSYTTAKGTYAIIVECGGSPVIYKSAHNLSYDIFAKVFRDLHYARLHPTLVHERQILGNISLGEYIVCYHK